jgi:riboflavin synthase
MFTGLIEATASIEEIKRDRGGLEISIESDFVSQNVSAGDSVAIDGACLTVKRVEGSRVWFDVSKESTDRTIINYYQKGTEVNCELALRQGGRLGGHIVLGHIDTTGTILYALREREYTRIRVEFERLFSPLVVEKGSIAINGVSLTINEVGVNFVDIMIIPHTLEKTNLRLLKACSRVNIEFDIIGKYVYRMMSQSSLRDDRLKRLIEEGEV